MRKYFHFERLIKKYAGEFVPLTFSYGYYDDLGDWINGETISQTIVGAVVSHRENKVHRSEGTLTSKDKRLFTLAAIDGALINSTVQYGNNIYRIEDCLENAEFTGAWSYTLRFISAFNEKRPEYDISEEVDKLEKRLDGTLVPDDQIAETESNEVGTTLNNYVQEILKRSGVK